MRQRLKENGFPQDQFKLHRMRNTWAVDQIRSRVPETVIAQNGGWKSTSMIRYYANKLPLDILETYAGVATDRYREAVA